MKTTIISSSLAPDSRSFILCIEAKKQLEAKGVEVTLLDVRELDLALVFQGEGNLAPLIEAITSADNIIFGMGVHNYSISDSLKALLDRTGKELTSKFYGLLCAAGGIRSFLAPMQVTQICLNQWHMMQFPQVVYATGADFEGSEIKSEDVKERLTSFVEGFVEIGSKLV
jgi:NAD(P)H-dependent FMN reductase